MGHSSRTKWGNKKLESSHRHFEYFLNAVVPSINEEKDNDIIDSKLQGTDMYRYNTRKD